MEQVAGLGWITAISAVTVYVWSKAHTHDGGSQWPLPRLVVASIVLLMLGIHAADSSTGGGIGLATVARGVLSSAALLFAVRVLTVNAMTVAPHERRSAKALMLLSVYAAVAVLSIMYSVAPIETAGKAYELCVAMVVAWSIAKGPAPRSQFRAAVDLVVLIWATMIAVAILGFFALPSQFWQTTESRPGFIFVSTMGAPYAHSNGLSAIGAAVAAYGLARGLRAKRLRDQRWSYLLATIGSVGIMLASGRQGVLIWSVTIALLLFLYARPLFIFFFVPVTAFALYEWSGLLWNVLTRQQQQVTLYTLSGRLNFWDAAIQAWLDQPVLGFGFGVGGRYEALPRIGLDNIDSLHSGFFEALVGVGLLGTTPLILALILVLGWSLTRLRRAIDVHYAILILPLILHTSVSLGVAAWLTSQFIIFAFLAGCADSTALRCQVSVPAGARTSKASSAPQGR